MRFTHQLIDKLRTSNGGYDKKTIMAMGVRWPLERGWRRSLIGRKLTPSAIKLLEQRGVPIPRRVLAEGLEAEALLAIEDLAVDPDKTHRQRFAALSRIAEIARARAMEHLDLCENTEPEAAAEKIEIDPTKWHPRDVATSGQP